MQEKILIASPNIAYAFCIFSCVFKTAMLDWISLRSDMHS